MLVDRIKSWFCLILKFRSPSGHITFWFPHCRAKKKVVVKSIYGYQNLSGEKYKTNEKRISSIGHTSEEKNPKNHPKMPFFWNFIWMKTNNELGMLRIVDVSLESLIVRICKFCLQLQMSAQCAHTAKQTRTLWERGKMTRGLEWVMTIKHVLLTTLNVKRSPTPFCKMTPKWSHRGASLGLS